METRAHRILSVVLALMFLAFAGLQFNDPDPELWVTIYLIPTALCVWNAFGRSPWPLPAIATLAAIVAAILWWPQDFKGVTGTMEGRPEVELARESLGLGICALATIYLTWRSWKRR